MATSTLSSVGRSSSSRYRQTDGYLEVAAVAPPEGQDEAFEDQLSDLWELGVDDGDDGRVDVSEGGRRRLGLQHRARQQTPERQTGGRSSSWMMWTMLDTLTLLIRPLMDFFRASQLILW
ncbi:hypothetical protein EYF80_046844 [Liparis tanakae]|uniref:Uncharacterized protein n=1 Tax=Liparis tanakae TaxID=230148 RepID=A0A4Z2FQG6_9TELE|nr:hypothetical protein EYF80_046844 [Liparis tanakae]